jgi:limonene-1,2-epoxide hydrolase
MTHETSEPPPSVSVVIAFLTALARGDADAAVDLVHPDIAYTNVGWPTVRGRAATARLLRALGRRCSFDVELINVSADGGVVLTERIDELGVGRLRCQFWVCGRFEIRDGLVIVWRDYFDHLHVLGRLLRAAAALAVPGLQRPLPGSLRPPALESEDGARPGGR